FGEWINPAVASALQSAGSAAWLNGLITDGIVGGVGAVLSFVPQMMLLFIFLAFLEACGYMSRIAFIMDKIFRRFGLSGKSFIPMLVGTGCSVPGIMASRTIENIRDRRMTVMTTPFMPCGAKLPVIALISGAMFGGIWWIAPSAYFIGIAAIACSGIILKKTKPFEGEPAAFVLELPAYHMPTVLNILRSMWERVRSFIKKAGTIILLASVVIWFLSNFGFESGSFGFVSMENSLLARIGGLLSVIFAPLGWGDWKASAATVNGLIAKENIVSTFGVLYGDNVRASLREVYTPLAGYSFLIFNLLCAPCVAAIGATRREMNSGKWTAFAIIYQCAFAYALSLCIYQLGMLINGKPNTAGTAAAFIILVVFIFMLICPDKRKGASSCTVR
ncbi:MAG: ferrous iron transport protein B, partial [Eubacteriales bacterium]|nr:ferrous iron transport protein B [Eubacteriales bacterium]